MTDLDLETIWDDAGPPRQDPPSSERKISQPSWPQLGAAAFRGVAGEVVRTIEPHTEADPAALLLDFLVSFGSAVGAGPRAFADGAEHPARLNVVQVGETARARKGTSRANIARVFAEADPGWSANRVMGGLSTGEGLIAAVRDGDDEEDQGVQDKRLLVVEPEFARVLGVAARDGNTLSAIVRDAWDSGRLRVMTRKAPLVATGAHVSIIGHVTVEELRRRLTDTEAANGFANRFLFACVRRSKLLPSGGNLTEDDFRRLGRLCRYALEGARKVMLLRRSGSAEEHWDALYREIAAGDKGGLVGAVTARAEAQCLRLSVVYALVDGVSTIEVEHLEAAHAVWQYAEASAEWIFGSSTGDPLADRLLEAIRKAGPKGMDRTAQRDLFSRHVGEERISLARLSLLSSSLVTEERQDTGGRPRYVCFALPPPLLATEATKATEGWTNGA